MPNRTQLELDLTLFNPELTPEELSAFMNEGMPRTVDVTLTRNRVTMITIEVEPTGAIKLRLHEHFKAAPLTVLRALRRYLKGRRRADWKIASDYAQSITPALRKQKRAKRLKMQGEVYNLREIRDLVNKEFFNDHLSVRIGWGRQTPATGKRRSIRYGSYDCVEKTVTIHPALDAHNIPFEFVKYIVFHEMLHAVIPPVTEDGQTRFHPPAFKQVERTYPDYRRMVKLSKSILQELH